MCVTQSATYDANTFPVWLICWLLHYVITALSWYKTQGFLMGFIYRIHKFTQGIRTPARSSWTWKTRRKQSCLERLQQIALQTVVLWFTKICLLIIHSHMNFLVLFFASFLAKLSFHKGKQTVFIKKVKTFSINQSQYNIFSELDFSSCKISKNKKVIFCKL